MSDEHKLKCTCILCNGTGIYKESPQSEFGVLCNGCSGLGYMSLKHNEDVNYFVDENTNTIIVTYDNGIKYRVELFKELQIRDDVKFVMLESQKKIKSKIGFLYAVRKHHIISYLEFLDGVLPLPSEHYVCPENIMRLYSDKNFKDDCVLYGNYNVCDKSCSEECWKSFYGNVNSYEEKQKVLKKILQ